MTFGFASTKRSAASGVLLAPPGIRRAISSEGGPPSLPPHHHHAHPLLSGVGDSILIAPVEQVVLRRASGELPGIDQLEKIFRSILERESSITDQTFLLRPDGSIPRAAVSGEAACPCLPTDAVEVIHIDLIHVQLFELLLHDFAPFVPVGLPDRVFGGEENLFPLAVLQGAAHRDLALPVAASESRVDVTTPSPKGDGFSVNA